MAEVFISYSRKDRRWLDKLRPHLHPLEQDGRVEIWDDTRIKPGDEWLTEINKALDSARAAVLLVSADFLASGFIMRKEVPVLLARVASRGCLILPVILRPCRFSEMQALQRFQAINSPGQPLSKLRRTADAEDFLLKTAQSVFARLREPPVRMGCPEDTASDGSANSGVNQVESLVRSVKLGDWEAAERAAVNIIAKTDGARRNDVFATILKYLDCSEDDEKLWGAIQTIESCVSLAPWLVSHEQLFRMAKHSNFSVRSCAACICLELAQFAPDRVPLDILLTLSVYDEDWYVEVPANAALKTLVRSSPAVLQIFYRRLQSDIADERSHAAAALVDIADHEPGLLDPRRLFLALNQLRKTGDEEAMRYLSRATAKSRKVRRIKRGRYGF